MLSAAADLRPPAGAQAARRTRFRGLPDPKGHRISPGGTKCSAKLARCRLGTGHASAPVSEATFSLKLPASLVRPNAQAGAAGGAGPLQAAIGLLTLIERSRLVPASGNRNGAALRLLIGN
jgi:hypothetical protein